MMNGTMLDELSAELGMDAFDILSLVAETCTAEIMEVRRMRRKRRIEAVETGEDEALWIGGWPEAASAALVA